MIKKCFTIAIVLMFVGEVLAAGFQLSFGGGYGFAAGRQYVGSNYEMDTDTTYESWKDVRSSFGSGIKFDLDATILFNDNFGLIMGTGISILGGFKLEGKDPTSESTQKMRGNYLPITVGLKLQAGNGKLLPYVYIAPGLFIPLGVKGEYTYKEEGLPEEKNETTTKFALGLGVSSGLGFLLNLSNSFGIKFECAPTYAFARLKETTMEYDDGSKATFIYKKNEEDLPDDDIDDPDDITYYYHGAYMYSFSSIAAKVGLLLSF